jgi:hypothetical protein
MTVVRDPARSPPLQIQLLAVLRVLGVEAVELECRAGFGQVQIDPTARGALFEEPCCGGEVDEMDGFALLVLPLVGVAEDVGFDLLAGEDDVEEGFGVFEAA